MYFRLTLKNTTWFYHLSQELWATLLPELYYLEQVSLLRVSRQEASLLVSKVSCKMGMLSMLEIFQVPCMAAQQVVLLQLHNQLVLLELQWLQRPPLLLQLPVLPMPQVEVKSENAEKASTMITAIRHFI